MQITLYFRELNIKQIAGALEAIFAQIRLHGAVGILTYCLLSLRHKKFEIHCTTDIAKAGSNLQFVNLWILIILLFFDSSLCKLNCMHSHETHRTFLKFRRQAQHLSASLAGCFKNSSFIRTGWFFALLQEHH